MREALWPILLLVLMLWAVALFACPPIPPGQADDESVDLFLGMAAYTFTLPDQTTLVEWYHVLRLEHDSHENPNESLLESHPFMTHHFNKDGVVIGMWLDTATPPRGVCEELKSMVP
jgi:hypothetical protein